MVICAQRLVDDAEPVGNKAENTAAFAPLVVALPNGVASSVIVPDPLVMLIAGPAVNVALLNVLPVLLVQHANGLVC
jgi:hypothetical protein